MPIRAFMCAVMMCGLAGVAPASGGGPVLATGDLPAPGSVTADDGAAAWGRIRDVVQHPRCLNCHVGADNIPLNRPAPGDRAIPHVMAIDAGPGRDGGFNLSCGSCHVTSTRPNVVPHAAPHTGMDWRLAPVTFSWTGRSGAEICRQLRDPARNGGRDGAALVDHILHDADVIGFIAWSFDPRAGRVPAPGGLQAHLEDMAIWTAAGMPCPGD